MHDLVAIMKETISMTAIKVIANVDTSIIINRFEVVPITRNKKKYVRL